MVSVYPNPPAEQDFYGCYPMGDPMMNQTGLPGLYPVQPEATGNYAIGEVSNVNVNSGTGLVGQEDPNKKVRKPYTITKSRESWTEQEHDKFLEALQLFDRDWKKIEAFVGSKTVIQIRSHAQKYFLKVQKSGANEHVPPPRPKRKASHPYPQKAAKSAVSQVKAPFQSSTPLVEPGCLIRSDSLSVPGNPINPSLSAWTYNSAPAFSISHGSKDYMVPSTVTQNCSSSSSETAPKIWPTSEAIYQGKETQDKPTRAMPDFSQVYSFIGSVFDPSSSDHVQRLRKMDPIDIETVLMLMKNLSVNLVSPELEGHRKLLWSYNGSSGKDKAVASTKSHRDGRPGQAIASV